MIPSGCASGIRLFLAYHESMFNVEILGILSRDSWWNTDASATINVTGSSIYYILLNFQIELEYQRSRQLRQGLRSRQQ